jgi:hypothetical protein
LPLGTSVSVTYAFVRRPSAFSALVALQQDRSLSNSEKMRRTCWVSALVDDVLLIHDVQPEDRLAADVFALGFNGSRRSPAREPIVENRRLRYRSLLKIAMEY